MIKEVQKRFKTREAEEKEKEVSVLAVKYPVEGIQAQWMLLHISVVLMYDRISVSTHTCQHNPPEED